MKKSAIERKKATCMSKELLILLGLCALNPLAVHDEVVRNNERILRVFREQGCVDFTLFNPTLLGHLSDNLMENQDS